MLLIPPEDIQKIDSVFKRVQITEQIHMLESVAHSFFSLQLMILDDSELSLQSLKAQQDSKLLQRSYFIISAKWADWIPQLLHLGAFDVMVGPLRYLEFLGKLNHFFSDAYQYYLLKKDPPFQLDLTRKEQQLFDFLVTHPKGVTRQDLMTLCWKNIVVHPKTLDVHLFNLRQKLEQVGGAVHFSQGYWYLKLKT